MFQTIGANISETVHCVGKDTTPVMVAVIAALTLSALVVNATGNATLKGT